MNFFHHKDLENHLLQLCPKVVKHPVYLIYKSVVTFTKFLGHLMMMFQLHNDGGNSKTVNEQKNLEETVTQAHYFT